MLTLKQLVEWEAMYAIEPWGTLVEDRRFGVLAKFVAEPYRNKKNFPDFFEECDLFPRLTPHLTKEEKAAQAKEKKAAAARLAKAQHEFKKKMAGVKPMQRVRKPMRKQAADQGD